MTSLERQAERRGVAPPSAATLRKYGLTRDDWIALLKAQGWRCPICLRHSPALKWVVDHHHVPMWSSLTPEQRKRHVRGILDSWCNHRRVHSEMGAAEAQRMADYFKAHETRRDA